MMRIQGFKGLFGLSVFVLMALTAALPGCGGWGGGGRDNVNVNVNVNVNFNCPGRLEPVAHTGQTEIVGDGTAAGCSESALRDAVQAINDSGSGGTITFDCGGAHTIVLTQSLFVDASLIVDGDDLVTISGGGTTRVFELDNYTDFTVQRLTISDGHTEESGAGILHPWFGTLKAIDVRFENNHCTSQDHDIGGGAVFAGGLTEAVFSNCQFINNSASNGGGLLNRGTNLTVVDCVFSGNTATSYSDSGQYGNGGGLYIDGMNYENPGGDLYLCGTLFENNNAKQHGSAMFGYFYEGSVSYIDRCVFRDNNFDGSPGGGSGGVYHQAVPLVLTNSTIAYNTSGAHAAGLFIGSGSSADIINCTFAHNTTPGNGAGLFGGSNPINITNCTFSANDADYGPAIFKGQDGRILLTNTLFADNTTDNQYSALACHEPFADGGGNIQWPDTKGSGSADTACVDGILFADPLLGPLDDYGGPTPTMSLSAGSPAIDYGSDCPPADQRGMGRVGPCDSGAFEYQP